MIRDFAHALHLSNVTFYTLLFGVLIIIALLLGFTLNRVFHHWTKKLPTGTAKLVFSLLESLPLPLLLIASLYLGVESLPLPARYEYIGSKVMLALVIVVVMYFPANAIVVALRQASQRDPRLLRVTQPAAFAVRTLFAVLGTIIFLENLNVSLTAIWTTLGVGSVAVALALQETLSNFFSGLYLLADQPVSPNDYIKLDTNQEGYVLHIGWRSTVLRTLGNNYVVIPNATLAKATIINYSTPDSRMLYTLPVSVASSTDPEAVERALLEVASEAIQDGLEGLLAEPPPAVRFITGFGQSSLDFSLNVHIRQFPDQFLIQSELRKRIVKKFKQAGITMPFPTRTLVFDKSTRSLLRDSSKD